MLPGFPIAMSSSRESTAHAADLQTGVEQALRTVPVQARAKESVNKILETAALLLDEVGLEAFNTNLLAERAGVRIRTVYRYFPDKYSVIIALAHHLAAEWDGWMAEEYVKLSDPESDWESVQKRHISAWLKKLSKQPGGASVIKALRTVPELQKIDLKLLDQMTANMAAALMARGLKLSKSKVRVICHVALLTVDAGIEHYVRLSERERKPFLDELIKMHIIYLREYL